MNYWGIGRDQGLTVFHRRYPRELVYRVHITDILPDTCHVYIRPNYRWFVLFSDKEIITHLQSSRLSLFQKTPARSFMMVERRFPRS